MKAKEKKFLHFLEGSDKHFVIPVYQRNYDWKKEHCKQLYDDLIDISKNERTHFLGSIVSIYHDDGEDREYLIIDGQQRLTTLSLLLLAIYKFLEKTPTSTIVNMDQIRDEYLVNKYSTDKKKIRLKPVKNDKKAFSSLFRDESDYIQDSNITINYKYFSDRISEKEISIEKLFSAIKQLVIVEIELRNTEDDPQLIFESLNSTGLDLTEADKVRNFVLMKESATKQERLYNEYWNKIEDNTNYNVSGFIRDYLTIKERMIPNKNKVYLEFKRYANVCNNTTEELLADLLKFSTYYKKIITAQGSHDKASLAIQKINKLETVVAYPFIMEIFDDEKQEVLKYDELTSILEIIINFVFRRLICEVPTNALNKIFMVMGREIKKHEDYVDNYLEIFKYILIRKKLSQRFPADDEFSSKIMVRDVYNFKSKNKLFLLEQLENFDNKERVDVEGLINTNSLSIEHIMPCTLTPDWRQKLGDDFQDIHEKYLNTLGNLTLTAYNSNMSNKPFLEKRDMDKGFVDSRLYLNKSLHQLEVWNKSEILKRTESLKERALKIWGYPSSSYQSSKEQLKLFTLDDDDKDFTGEKVMSFKFMDDGEEMTNSWKDLYENICKTLCELDPIKFKQIIINNKFDYKGNGTRDRIIVNSISVYSNLNIEMFLSRLRVLVKEIGLDLNDLSFIIE